MRRAPQVTWKGRSISRRASCDTPFTLRDAFWACNWRTRRSPCPFCRAEHALTPDPCRSNVSATRGATFPQRLCDNRRTSFAARRNEPGTPGWDTFCSARRGVRARRTAVDRIGARRLSMDIRSVVRGVAGDGDLLGSPEVRVAVLDGPVDSAHPCFVGANLTRPHTLVSDPAGPGPMSLHGTRVTSLLFGQPGSPVHGLVPRCTGLLLPVFRESPDGRVTRVPQLDLAAGERGPRPGRHGPPQGQRGRQIPCGESHLTHHQKPLLRW